MLHSGMMLDSYLMAAYPARTRSDAPTAAGAGGEGGEGGEATPPRR